MDHSVTPGQTLNNDRNRHVLRRQGILSNPDIISHVFSFLSQRELLPCITVNRGMSESALDEIWASMETFLPLLRLLPSLEEVSPMRYMYYGDITTEKSNHIFFRNSRRVRAFTVTTKTEDILGIFPLLSRLTFQIGHRGSYLFPALQKLRCSVPYPHIAHIASLLISPSLSTMSICGESGTQAEETHKSQDIGRLFSLLNPANSASLKIMHVEGANLTMPLLRALGLVKTLESLHLFGTTLPGTDEMRYLLAAFQNLKCLRLGIIQSVFQGFDQIDKLLAGCEGREGIIWPPSFKRSRLQHLTAFHVDFTLLRPFVGSTIASLFPYLRFAKSMKMVCTLPAKQMGRLTSLAVFLGGTHCHTIDITWRTPDARCFVGDLLPVFASSSHLRHLSLQITSVVEPQAADAIFQRMADNDSVIETLLLPHNCGATLETLVTASKVTTGLKTLVLSLDSSVGLEEARKKAQDKRSRSTVSHLRIFDTRTKPFHPREYRSIADLCTRIFPKLVSITPSKVYGDDGKGDEWEHIEEWRKVTQR